MALFRKTIEPRCAYCRHGASIGENEVACYYKGVMDGSYRCRRFRYDPLRRVPPPPAQLRRDYKPEDFSL